jgi:hypothetical protein
VEDTELVARERAPAEGFGLGCPLGDHLFDGLGAPGELGHQIGGNSVNFSLGHPAGDGWHLLPRDAGALGHQVLDDAGVALREGDDPRVEGLAVQGPPGHARPGSVSKAANVRL